MRRLAPLIDRLGISLSIASFVLCFLTLQAAAEKLATSEQYLLFFIPFLILTCLTPLYFVWGMYRLLLFKDCPTIKPAYIVAYSIVAFIVWMSLPGFLSTRKQMFLHPEWHTNWSPTSAASCELRGRDIPLTACNTVIHRAR